MNKFAFDLIYAISCDGLGNESWGVVENVADTVNYFGSKERASLSGKWLYLYAEKDAEFFFVATRPDRAYDGPARGR